MSSRKNFINLVVASAVVCPVHAQTVSDWLPLVKFRPGITQQASLMTRPVEGVEGIWYFQKIEAGTGPLHLDSYGFTVVKPPKVAGREIKPDELMHWARTQLADFLDPSLAVPEVEGFEDKWRWQSLAGAAGTVLHINLPSAVPAGTACLLVGEQTPSTWTLTTVHPARADRQSWPVSGNRTFFWKEVRSTEPEPEEAKPGKRASRPAPVKPGFKPFTITTQGAWRLPAGTDTAKTEAIAAREAALWKGYMERFQAFITKQGGECAPAGFPDGGMVQEWEPIRNTSFFPEVHWMDPEGSWTSTDPKARFKLVIHPGFRQADFVERSNSGRELSRTVPILPADDGTGWKVERSSVEPEVLDFLGFDAKSSAQISAAAPGPSYLVFNRKGLVLKARWFGFIVERDGKGGVAAIKAPGAARPKEYDFALTPVP